MNTERALEELQHELDRARKSNPLQELVDALTEKSERGWSTPVQETLRWCAEDAVAAETRRDLWLTVEKVHENLVLNTNVHTTLVEAFVVWFREVADQVTFGWSEDSSTSQWHNVTQRTKAEATRGWLRDNRWMFEQCTAVAQ